MHFGKLVLSFAILLIIGLQALSQCTVYYCEGCVRNGLCPVSRTFDTYEEAYASAKSACPAATPKIRCGSESNHHAAKGSYSPVLYGIAGGLVGGLLGSFSTYCNGKTHLTTGAAAGYFLLSTFQVIVNKKHLKRSLGANLALGTISFACAGYAIGNLINAQKCKNSMQGSTGTYTYNSSLTLLSTLSGAGIGAVISFSFPRKK